jgi:hypothetical protein
LDNEKSPERERPDIMPRETEGYVYHCYGDDGYLRHTVASVVTLRRYDRRRPIALYCPPRHQGLLQQHGLGSLFHVQGCLPDEECSIVGFKHNLHKYKPFDKCLYLDSDMIWCRSPDRLWVQLAPYSFTATGIDLADAYFGGPKGASVFWDWIRNRRGTTMRHFGLTHLPRIQAGMIYAHDSAVTADLWFGGGLPGSEISDPFSQQTDRRQKGGKLRMEFGNGLQRLAHSHISLVPRL